MRSMDSQANIDGIKGNTTSLLHATNQKVNRNKLLERAKALISQDYTQLNTSGISMSDSFLGKSFTADDVLQDNSVNNKGTLDRRI